MLSSAGVYAIRLKGTRRAYIGSSIDVKARLGRHRKVLNENRHPNTHLQRAWNKYGAKRFIFEVVQRCKKESVLFFEQRYMNKYRSYERGFNQTACAGNVGGMKHSLKALTKLKVAWTPERKAVMSTRVAAKWSSLKGRQRQRLLKNIDRTGCLHTAATRKKLKAIWTPERKAAMSEHVRLHTTAATRKKLSESVKASCTPERRAVMSAAMKRWWAGLKGSQRLPTAATRKKMSVPQKASWTPERRAAMSMRASTQMVAQWAGLTGRQRQMRLKKMDSTGRTHTASARKKISESLKRGWAAYHHAQRAA